MIEMMGNQDDNANKHLPPYCMIEMMGNQDDNANKHLPPYCMIELMVNQDVNANKHLPPYCMIELMVNQDDNANKHIPLYCMIPDNEKWRIALVREIMDAKSRIIEVANIPNSFQFGPSPEHYPDRAMLNFRERRLRMTSTELEQGEIHILYKFVYSSPHNFSAKKVPERVEEFR